MMVDPVADSGGGGSLGGSALMRELLLTLPLAVAYVAGPDLVFEFANEQCRRLAGGRDLTGISLREVPELAGRRLESIERAVRTGQPLQADDCEVWIRRQGLQPELMLVNFTYQPVRAENGELDGMLVYGSDVTAYARDPREHAGRWPAGQDRAALRTPAQDALRASERLAFLQRVRQNTSELMRVEHHRRRLETELRQGERLQAVGQLTSGISHNFSNLLAIVLGYAEMAESLTEDDRDPELHRILGEIRSAANRAIDLSGDLVRFSRALRPKLANVDLNDLISGLTDMLTVSMGGRAEVVFEPWSTALPAARTDPSQLEQVLLNLAVNARDAMPDGGKLIISTRPANFGGDRSRPHPGTRFVELAVRDSGTGMSAEVRERIFERFFTTKAAGTGAGLGLFTVHGIISSLGGIIEVDSQQGLGTTFRIYLPAISG
jgi:signal transduction histidine kinase